MSMVLMEIVLFFLFLFPFVLFLDWCLGTVRERYAKDRMKKVEERQPSNAVVWRGCAD